MQIGMTSEPPMMVMKSEQEEDEEKNLRFLKSLLNKTLKIQLSDLRVVIGVFLCTDRDSNVILGQCQEFANEGQIYDDDDNSRMLGLAMVPGKHIVKLEADLPRHKKQQNNGVESLDLRLENSLENQRNRL